MDDSKSSDKDVTKRSVTDMLITSSAAGLTAGIFSYLFLGDAGSSLDVAGYTIPASVFTGGAVGVGSLAGQYASQKVIPKLGKWWPSWSNETKKQVADIIPTAMAGLGATAAMGVMLMELPSVQGGATTFALGGGSYLASEMALDMLLYTKTPISYNYM